MDSRAPLVAINGLLQEKTTGDRLSLPLRYAERVREAGGVPVAIPPIGDKRYLLALLDMVDAVVLSGGDDFDTERLDMGPTHPAAACVPGPKQDFDFELARLVLDRGVPVLGICYGMQLLGLADGATLLQHLPEDRPGGQEHTDGAVHDILIELPTKLGSLIGLESLAVVSRHHQALKDAPPGWRVAARDSEGLIEAIEHPSHPFALGVQWHPELSPGSAHDALFSGLVLAARERRASLLTSQA
jgi:putative glutamine amidotransferase